MPPDERPIPRYIAEPPQDALPYGRWADTLADYFLTASKRIETEDDIGQPGEIVWFPDRTFGGRTYVPAAAPTSTGYELFGYVSFTREHEGAEAADFLALADYTNETAAENQIGRASCRERGEVSVVGGALKNKRKQVECG